MATLRRARLGIVFVGLLALGGLGLLEAGAFALLSLRSGWPSRAELQQELGEPGTPASDPAAALDRSKPPERMGNVLHPFLGFVRKRNPGGRNLVNGRPVDLPVNDQGFFGPSPLDPLPADTARVALTGGSVATELFLEARDELARGLEAGGAFGGRRVQIVSLALGGMKQPQQLMALGWFLSLGAPIDAVINLDGFNELALTLEQVRNFGVFPAYPARWRLLAAQRVDPEAAALLGRIALEREQLQEARRFHARPILRSSSLALTLWHVRRTRSAARVAALEDRLAARLAGDGEAGVQETGPPYADGSIDAILDDAARFWARSSLQLGRLCAANGIRYGQFLQPNQHVPGSKVLSPRERERAGAPPDTVARIAAERGYPKLRAEASMLTAAGLHFVDLTGLFRDEPRTVYRDACCHLNRRGYRRIAEAIAAAFGDGSGAPRSRADPADAAVRQSS